jgi:hypothetical protein
LNAEGSTQASVAPVKLSPIENILNNVIQEHSRSQNELYANLVASLDKNSQSRADFASIETFNKMLPFVQTAYNNMSKAVELVEGDTVVHDNKFIEQARGLESFCAEFSKQANKQFSSLLT